MIVRKAFNYRFFPSDEQAAQFARTFGCARFVYNQALEFRGNAWLQEKKSIVCARKGEQSMKSRTTRNIQIEKQARRVLRKAAGAGRQSDTKSEVGRKGAKKGTAK